MPAPAPDVATSAPRGRLTGLLPDDRVTRRLAVQTLVNTLGNGLFFTTSAVFFTRSVGLSAGQVGLGLTIAGACGVAAGIPFGQLGDRFGARRTMVVLSLLEAVGLLGYALVHSFPAFLAVSCLVTVIDRGSSAVRGALIAVTLPAEGRVRGRAYLRAVTNVGMGAGSAVAALALQADTRAGYLALVAADAVTFAISAALLAGLPTTDHPAAATAPATAPNRWGALTDGRYLLITALNAILAIHFGLFEVAVPLWVVQDTKAPPALVSALMVLNTVMVVLFQVRAARGTEDITRAARTARFAGLLLGVACLTYGLAHGISPVLAIAVLLLAGVLHTLAEILSSAAGWALSYELADPAAPGAYQGVYNSGFAAATMIAPVLATGTAIRFGLPGWLLLGALFIAAGTALVPATRWAATRRRA